MNANSSYHTIPVTSTQQKTLPHVEIYCDGCAIPNPGAGGIGVVLVFGEHTKELSEPIGRATNQAAEIKAATAALWALTRRCDVTVYSDSKYLIETMNGNYSRKANLDLWHDLDMAAKTHEVEWRWVKGHDGNPNNERADKLALIGAQRNERGS